MEVQVSNRHSQDESLLRAYDSLSIYNPVVKQVNEHKMVYQPVVVNITKIPL